MIGELIEHYRILQRLGEGGMGMVYRALDTQLEREVALKVLRGDLSDEPEVTKRFRAEAITLARLSHPHIATLFGLARHGPQLCMVMEYVQGPTLAHVLRDGPALGHDRAVRLASQVLSALDYAHLAGVVHRDIKPSNVIVSKADVAKVLDFGIARVLNADRMTRQGFILGTPQYMAPEQIRGAELDGRADVYSVGVLLYEMLARQLPFRADNELALMYAHLEGRIVPLADVVPDAPTWLCDVVARALAKAPEARFGSAAEFRDALEQRARTPIRLEAPTVLVSGILPAPEVPPPQISSGLGGRLARVRSWLLPRFTWEYYAGPDGLLTVKRAVKMPAASQPAMSAARESATGASRKWPAAAAAMGIVIVAVAGLRWFQRTPVDSGPPRVVGAAPGPSSSIPSPQPSGPPPAAPSTTSTPAPPLGVAPAPSARSTAPPPRVVARSEPEPEPVERRETTPAPLTPAPIVEAGKPAPPPPAAEPAAPARTLPANIANEAFDEVVLLIPRDRDYDELEVRVTFERDRLVVFDQEEERVVATVAFANGGAAGAAVTGPASLLIGSEHWFILPTTAGRIVLQVDEEIAGRIVAAFEARSGTRVSKNRGELGG